MPCLEESISLLSSPYCGLDILSTLSSMMPPELCMVLERGGHWYGESICDWIFTVTDCQHFDKLWVSAFAVVHHKRNRLWPKLRAAQIYRYKYFKVRLTTWPISETSPVASFLGPMIWVVSVPDVTSVCHIFLQDPCVLVRKHFLYHPKLPTPH